MKRLWMLLAATTLMVGPICAQAQPAQTRNDMTTPEFREVLMDLGSYLDAHKGTDLHRQFEALPEDSLRQLMSAIPNLRRFQTAVTALKEHDAARGAQSKMPRPEGANATSIVPLAAFPACTPNTIIDNSPGAQCTPAYPDPNNGGWQAMVNPLITFGAFSPSTFASVSSQACGLTVETNLQQVTVALQGAIESLTPICSTIPPVINIACWAPAAAIAVAGSVSAGLFSDCIEQDGLVNAAEIDAGFHNTVTIFNDLNTSVAGLNTHLTNVDSDINTHLTNVDNHVAAEFVALDAHLVALFTQLTNQITQSTALSDAQLKQVMKLLLTPDGRKQINPAILTCTGTNCPNVLAACPAAGCSWNDAGPLP
jgi:hypothetical protein